MKILKEIQQDEVWSNWKEVERVHEGYLFWRLDIRCLLPCKHNIRWFLAEIEEKDLEKMYIISSDDWRTVTSTFTLHDATATFNKGISDEKVEKILAMKRIYEDNIDGLDRKFILVAPSIEGNLTIIEGNKRAVALLSMGKLIGNQIYLGISDEIKNYFWARHSS